MQEELHLQGRDLHRVRQCQEPQLQDQGVQGVQKVGFVKNKFIYSLYKCAKNVILSPNFLALNENTIFLENILSNMYVYECLLMTSEHDIDRAIISFWKSNFPKTQ